MAVLGYFAGDVNCFFLAEVAEFSPGAIAEIFSLLRFALLKSFRRGIEEAPLAP